MKTPMPICNTARMTDIFILSELRYCSSLLPKCHVGSIPTGYTQSGLNVVLNAVLTCSPSLALGGCAACISYMS